MKRSKRIYMLLGVLAVVGIATVGVLKYEEEKELIKNTDEVILEISPDEVTAISWEHESNALSFHKDTHWIYDEDEAFPVDDEIIQEYLSLFEAFGASFIIEEVEDYAQYGLDEPVCTIQIEAGETSYEILLGDYSTMDSERYVSIGDGNVYLVSVDPLDTFDATISEVIKHDEIPDMDIVTEIALNGSESYTIFYEEDSTNTYCEDDVYFTKQSSETVPLDTDLVEDYVQVITSMELTDYVSYNASEEEIASYGLDAPELVIEVNYTYEDEASEELAEDSFTLSISRDPEELAEIQSAETESESEDASSEDTDVDSEETDEEITAYARVGESGIIYQLTSDKYQALMECAYDHLRHQEAFSGNFDDVYQIDITLEGGVYTITSEKEDEKDDESERIYYYGEKEIELADFRSAVNDLEASEFTSEEPAQKQEISVTFYLDNENYPEVCVECYRYDGDDCLIVLDGESLCYVSRSRVVELIEAVNTIILNK